MSASDDYSRQPIQYQQPMTLPHSGGLNGWGILLIVLGSLAGLLAVMGLAGLALLLTAGKQMGIGIHSAGAAVAGALVEGLISGVLISVGVGTTRGRRWAGPLVSAVCIVSIVAGIASIVDYALVVCHEISLPNTAMPGTPFPQKLVMLAAAVVSAVFVAGLGIVLPIFMLRFFNREELRETLARMDPHPRWTDLLPLPLLVWIVACVGGGGSLALTSVSGVFPFFLSVLEGPPAVIASLFLGGAMATGGLLCLRRSTAGWLLSLLAVGAVAASTAVFSAAGDVNAYKQALTNGMDMTQRQMTADRLPGHLMVSSAMTYAAAAIYGSRVRRVLKQETPAVTPVAIPVIGAG